MDHGHAHPSHDLLSLARNERQQTPNRPSAFLGVPNTSSPLRRSPQTPFETPLSLPQRRLQLRNAGFRAPQLASHRLSTRISRWFSDRDSSHTRRQKIPARNQENSPPTVRRRNIQGSQTPSSILQEITNSTRSRYSDQNAFGPIYEDDQDDSPVNSWYHDAPSTQQSPVALEAVRENLSEMKLREISGNAQRSPPPLSSPLARQVTGRSKRSLNLRKTSFPASEHIVFLETKLEEVERSQYSPNTGLPLKDKIKALAAENNRLQELLAELEHQFETRLRESVEHKTGVEVNLRRKIKQLEEEIGSKNSRIRDLEYRDDASQRDLSNAEAYKAAFERLESDKRGLEETNRSLEKRNDVLTELLGQSPTRAHHGFELPSPVRDNNKKTPRPRSMMPRIPSSPSHSASTRPMSFHAGPSPFQHDYFSPLSALTRQHDHPCKRDDHVDPQRVSDDLRSIDSGLGDSCSVRSGNETLSKRSSMHSYSFGSPGAWGLPLPPSPTDSSMDKSCRKRKTRRFASGSTQLKPLVLPTLNATSGTPQSAPLPDFHSSQGRRDFSEGSIDPTYSFLSQLYDTPTQSRRRSNTWAAEDALKALEGNSEVHFVSFEEVLAKQTSRSIPETGVHFPDLPSYPNLDPSLDQFTPSLVDEVIMEEDSTAFLSNQVEDVRNQSISSMAGELSITGSDNDGVCADDRSLTTQFLEPELPRPLSLQLPSFIECGQLLENVTETDPPLTIQAGRGTPGVPASSSMMPLETDFPNPLVSPYYLPDASFQSVKATSARGRRGEPHGHKISQTPSSSPANVNEMPIRVQRHSTGIGLQTAEMMMPNPLKAAPSYSGSKTPPRPQSPLDLLQRKGRPTTPVHSVTTRTIFGRVSRYTTYMREIRRDPTALARRVIANAWCSNWKRFGKLSWWVLGLFLGAKWKQDAEITQGWEVYDGENIAQAEHERLNGPGPSFAQEMPGICLPNLETANQSTKPPQKRVEFQDELRNRGERSSEVQDTQTTQCRICDQGSKTSWGRSLYLWGKFSIALMLAVGGAVVQGPAEMLRDCDLHSDAASAQRSERFCRLPSQGEVDHQILFHYSHELAEHDLREPKSPESFRTAKSASRSALRPTRPPALAQDGHCTFGVPSMNGCDYYGDSGQSRPGESRALVLRERTQLRDLESSGTGLQGGPGNLGTLQWMKSLSVKDFERFQDTDEEWDRDRTIRGSPRKIGKRTYSTLS
jgi:hypothetical protein